MMMTGEGMIPLPQLPTISIPRPNGQNASSPHHHRGRRHGTANDGNKRAKADSARRMAELQKSSSSSLSWMALEEWRITFFYSLFVFFLRGALHWLVQWTSQGGRSATLIMEGRRGGIVVSECYATFRWLAGWALRRALRWLPEERVFNGTTTKTRISPGFIFSCSWILLLAIWKRRRSHFDAQIDASNAVQEERKGHGNVGGRRLSLAGATNQVFNVSKNSPMSNYDDSANFKKILIPSIPVRMAECMLGRYTPRAIAIILPVQFAASFMAAYFIARFAGLWLDLSDDFLAEALSPIVYHSTPSRPFLVDLGCEILASMVLSVSLLVLPELCHLNQWSKVLVMPLVMLPVLYGTGAFLANVDGSHQGSAFAPNILYALHCVNTATIHQVQRRAKRGGYLSFLFHDNLPLKQMSHILGPIVGGALGGKVMSIFFPDPEKW
jgi:hypothetical protein